MPAGKSEPARVRGRGKGGGEWGGEEVGLATDALEADRQRHARIQTHTQ